ncbi:MAG: LemA family protein [FCB group bacterium]|jgi:LemA protein|nr:LemA family protein [FCB group bacterium]
MGKWIGLGIIALLAFFVIGVYNGLVRLRNQVRNAWSQIDVQLKRRHDLIPNLLETVKGYAAHERQTLENVTNARAQALSARGVAETAQAETALTRALGQFNLVMENYPDLKASQNFMALQEELASTENKIGFARQFYNDQTMQYNTKLETFPNNIVAGIFRFQPAEFFEVEDAAERAVPKVSF